MCEHPYIFYGKALSARIKLNKAVEEQKGCKSLYSKGKDLESDETTDEMKRAKDSYHLMQSISCRLKDAYLALLK